MVTQGSVKDLERGLDGTLMKGGTGGGGWHTRVLLKDLKSKK